MTRLNVNQVLGLVLATFAVLYLVLAFQIPQFALPRPIDSDHFPKVLGTSLLVLSLMLFLEKPQARDIPDPVQSREEAALPAWQRPWARVIITFLAIAAYAALLVPLGFVLASMLLAVGLTVYYGYRRHGITLIATLGVVLGLYLIMTRVMDVYLPTGLLPL
ncbi:tripartite tricarboxylate transporter TctB family protein [Billgrantia lactosivorans]|uniref:tripartite tricarboxylate transporter TctB family protein n=1 Tax=Billgrantia lactosivorans TaxID=2185141 RepID=UPI000DAEFF67|nr:tripartite tricarboxylate transporter TctB family protein [Halomonas lactosivorans]